MTIHRTARTRPLTLSAGLLVLLAGGCSQWPATGYAPPPAEDSEIRTGLWESRYPDGENPLPGDETTTAWWRSSQAAPRAASSNQAPPRRTVSVTPGAAAPNVTESRSGVTPTYRPGTSPSGYETPASYHEASVSYAGTRPSNPTFYAGQKADTSGTPVIPTTDTTVGAPTNTPVTPAAAATGRTADSDATPGEPRFTQPRNAASTSVTSVPRGTETHAATRIAQVPEHRAAPTRPGESATRNTVPPRFVVAREGVPAARAARSNAPATRDNSWPVQEPLALSTAGAGAIVPQPGAQPAGWQHDPRPPAATGPHGSLHVPMNTGGEATEGGANVSQVSFALEGADFDPDVSRDGRLIVFASTQHQPNADVYIKGVGSRVVTQLTSDSAQDLMPKFSPDGTRIAFASNRGGNWDLYVMPSTGGNPVQVTSTASPELHPSWSPDGTQLVYCRLGDVSGQWELWVTDAANSGVSHFLGYGLFPEWCPTRGTGEGGTDKILVQRSRQRGDRAFSIWTIDYRDGQATNPTEVAASGSAACINPAWSPDGRWIVFAEVPNPSRWDAIGSGRPPTAELWMADLNGGARVKLTDGPALALMPAWGPEGRVFFVSDRGGVDNIWALNATESVRLAAGMSQPQNVANAPEGEVGNEDR
ncbi:MAG: DPP IV N-terminal domain-containing protein [Phycisphaerales bacterium]